jgi:glycosyltransferase involved in cell wall biosynthesis
VLVFPASLSVGGSQLNAIELAAALQRRGHEVSVFGSDGPLVDTVDALGLPFIPAPPRPKIRPSPAVMQRLNRVITDRSIELVHGYEWPPILESVYGPYLRHRTPVVGTVMSMAVAPFIPAYLDLVVGTEQIAAAERPTRRSVSLLEPPVDTELNRPVADPRDHRAELGADSSTFLIVVVSRLAKELKREGILEAIRACVALARDIPVRLVIVGDGPARDEIAYAARTANAQIGREVIVLLGERKDPRTAYAAADAVFGMGSSALRAMAFGKPLIVQGERGFWKMLTPDTESLFLHQGWYGIGDGSDGALRFEALVRKLYSDDLLRTELGEYARKLVLARYSLERAATLQERIYDAALSSVPPRRQAARCLARPATEVAVYQIMRRWNRRRGRASDDDFNALAMQPGRSKISNVKSRG